MSSIAIQDQARSTELDRHSMSAVRGGSGSGYGGSYGGYGLGKDINVNVNVTQELAQFQQIGISVLNNNGSIGPGVVGPRIDLNAPMKAGNTLQL